MEEITNGIFLEYIEKIKKENTPENLDKDEKYEVKITSVNKGVMFIEVVNVCIIPKVDEYEKHILEITVSKYNLANNKGELKETYPFINIKESIEIDTVEYYHDHGISFFNNIHDSVEDAIDDNLYSYLSDVILESAKFKSKLDTTINDKDIIRREMISGFLDDNIWNKTYKEERKDTFTNISMKIFMSIFNTSGILYNESKMK